MGDSPARVLVVDDEASIRALLSATLRRTGFDVRVAAGGEEALSVEDRISGLTFGADDYVTKPFSLEEVVLRIRAILRRSRGEVQPADSAVLRYADLEMDEDAHEVRRGGRPIDLSPTEFKLLRYLLTNAGKVVSKAQIIDRVWNYDFGGDGRIVESYVYSLMRPWRHWTVRRAGPPRADRVVDSAGKGALPGPIPSFL